MAKPLDKKRWSKEDIKKAAKIFLESEKSKGLGIRLLDEFVHWMTILLVFTGNSLLAVFLVFFSGFVTEIYFHMGTILLGFVFGLMIDTPVQDIEKLHKGKHFLLTVGVPLLAVVNIPILIGIKSLIEFYSGTVFDFNPLVTGTIYGISFLIPLAFGRLRKRVQSSRKKKG
ncbi:hypothetical protein GOV09_07195 [Candidatus Woesearchaeota archaeon]|nr:hypothetical protein [Candidatus Woesearchaeota archaeon]